MDFALPIPKKQGIDKSRRSKKSYIARYHRTSEMFKRLFRKGRGEQREGTTVEILEEDEKQVMLDEEEEALDKELADVMCDTAEFWYDTGKR